MLYRFVYLRILRIYYSRLMLDFLLCLNVRAYGRFVSNLVRRI